MLAQEASPTPVVSYNVAHRKAGGAIIITASHNPPIWNGFKYKPEYAGSASVAVVNALERHIGAVLRSGVVKSTTMADAGKQGLVEYIDSSAAYLQHVQKLVDLSAIKKAGLRIAVDSMYGAGAGYTKRLLDGGKSRVMEMNDTRNPLFPGMERPEPIAHNLKKLAAYVRRVKADVGLATDGDADRFGLIDEQGRFVNQLQTFALLTFYLLEVRKQRGPLVKSVTTSRMIEKLGKLYNVPVVETPVGFKYICPVMMKEDALIGGEESGGYGYRGHIPERDGIVSGLYVLDFMVKTKKSPAQLLKALFDKVGPHYYDRIDLVMPPERKASVQETIAKARPSQLDGVAVEGIDSMDGFRFLLKDGSWLMIRFSGTEPVLRIYGESSSTKRVAALLEAGRNMTGL